jgi:hypothetical protein
MNVWLDDMRPMPEGYGRHVVTAAEAIAVLQTGEVKRMSFDHDLGFEHYAGDYSKGGTGYDVACWVELAAKEGRVPPFIWAVHSANPVGRANIIRALQGAERWWTHAD